MGRELVEPLRTSGTRVSSAMKVEEGIEHEMTGFIDMVVSSGGLIVARGSAY